MVLIISKNSIEAKIRKENNMLASMRRQEDQMKGLCMSKGPTRGDFSLCRRTEESLRDMKRYGGTKDFKKAEKEYYGLQAEEREKARRQ